MAARNSGPKPAPPPPPPLDPAFKRAVERVYAKLPTAPGAFGGARVFFFKAKRLIEFLQTHKHKDFPKLHSEEEAVQFARKMVHSGLATRCELAEHTANQIRDGQSDVRIDLVLHKQARQFDPEDKFSVYKWDMEGSKTGLRFMSFGMIALTAGICMIKIWPLWLKILVYWTSLTLLITLSSLLVLRLFLYSCMWVVGFRGLWLFPNLLNDDLPFFDAFKPAFGRGVDDENNPDSDSGKTWDFGIINAVVLMGSGICVCWAIGMFDTQAIPDFVANQNDIYNQFPMLAPPGYTAPETETPHTESNGGVNTNEGVNGAVDENVAEVTVDLPIEDSVDEDQ